MKVPALSAEEEAAAAEVEAQKEEENRLHKKKKTIPKQMSNGNRAELAAKSSEKKGESRMKKDVADDWEQACDSSEDSESESESSERICCL